MSTPLAERLRAAFGSSPRTPVPDVAAPSQAPLPGREVQTEAGPYLLYEEHYPLDHRHGSLDLGACLTLPQRALACLAKAPALGDIDLRQAIFLDTETTGLAGGTGTTAFLVGIGHFAPHEEPSPTGGYAGLSHSPTLPVSRSPSFVIRQFFMRDFGEERAMLLALAEALAPFKYAVTFNGKSFDLPLLETRYVMARLARRRWQPELHFDLLHPARRLWRERLESCSLAALEEAILGHRRESDVPSWAIPGLYAAYLRGSDPGSLEMVFNHNRHDLLSLVTLATQLGRRLAEPLEHRLGADELLAVARLYEGLGWRSEAAECLELALERAQHAVPLRERIRLALALGYKRSGDRARAYKLWRELARGQSGIRGLIELAKHHEHQERDPTAALDCVEQALAILEVREARDGSDRWRAERADLERRLARLLRKRGVR